MHKMELCCLIQTRKSAVLYRGRGRYHDRLQREAVKRELRAEAAIGVKEEAVPAAKRGRVARGAEESARDA